VEFVDSKMSGYSFIQQNLKWLLVYIKFKFYVKFKWLLVYITKFISFSGWGYGSGYGGGYGNHGYGHQGYGYGRYYG